MTEPARAKKIHDVGDAQEIPRPSPGGFSLIGPDALWAPLEAPDYVIDGVVRRGSLTEIVAYGSSGKTWLTVDMMLSVAAGIPWLGRFATKAGRVTYLDYENGSYEMRRRLQAAAIGRGVKGPVAGLDVACMPDVYMSDPTFPARLASLAKERALIVVDTLKAADPLTDENDSKIRVGLDCMRRTGELTNCAFVVLLHSKKTSGSVSALDPREAGRGSSAIFDAADTVLHVQYSEGKPLQVVQTKARLGRTIEPFTVTIEDAAGGVRVVAADAPIGDGGDASGRFTRHCDEVLACVKTFPGTSKRLLSEKLHKHHTTVCAALEMLQRHGAVTSSGDGKNERWSAVERAKRSEDEG